jgi:hypothetical protein
VTNYYVYYRVDVTRLDSVRFSIQELFKVIERETGVRGRWMRRRDDPATYLEVYEGVADDAQFAALLAREAAGLGLERRQEIFTDAETPA